MFDSMVILVTGASSGIGEATAKLFAQMGATVYGTSRNPKPVAGIHMLKMDVCDDASVKEAVQSLIRRTRRLDIVVNNAGYGIAGPLSDTTPEEFSRQMDVNTTGVLRVVRETLPALLASRGRIINISSVAGFIPIPFQSGYSASKAAVESMSECLRAELEPSGVSVSLVEPGDTKTGFTKNRVRIAEISDRYTARFETSLARMEHDEQHGMEPGRVAHLIVKIAGKKNPPVRVVCGVSYKILRFIKRFLSDRLVYRIVSKLYA